MLYATCCGISWGISCVINKYNSNQEYENWIFNWTTNEETKSCRELYLLNYVALFQVKATKKTGINR